MRRKKSVNDELVDQIVDTHMKPKDRIESVEFISTGCIPLNLAASQKAMDGGWARGRINNIVGDGGSGKTLLALEAAAWFFYNIKNVISNIYPKVKKIIIIYNNVEGVLDFPVAEMFGQEFYDAVEWINTETCEEFGRDVQRRIMNLKPGEALLHIDDSLDAMISQAGKDRIEKSIKDDKEEDGSYGTEKAKYFSQSFFNNLCGLMKGKDATLILISQVRERLNVRFGKKLYRTGGKALDFYTHQVLWLYEKKKLDRTFRKRKIVYGVRILGKYERNKTAKPYREAEFRILFDYGIDNINSMIDYLCGNKEDIVYEDEQIGREDLVNRIESSDTFYQELVEAVRKDWDEIEDAISTKRKRRFIKS